MRLPDGARPHAVLLGASPFDDPELGDLSVVANNVAGLARVREPAPPRQG